MPEVSTMFPTRGPRTIGVQVLDDSGAAAFATLRGQRRARRQQARHPRRR